MSCESKFGDKPLKKPFGKWELILASNWALSIRPEIKKKRLLKNTEYYT